MSPLPLGVAAIAAAEESTCAVTTTGALKCWGRNRYGELGDGADNTDTATWNEGANTVAVPGSEALIGGEWTVYGLEARSLLVLIAK